MKQRHLASHQANDLTLPTVRNTPNPINVLRVIACFMVLFLHAYISTSAAGFSLYDYEHTLPWIFLLKTPAWAGVWIFFILSAYLAGRGFFTGRYAYSARGFGKYYLKKVVRIILPVYAFILLVCTFVYPLFLKENPIAIHRLFLFQYMGAPGVDGIGALWYMSTVMPVYLLAPFVCLVLDQTLGRLCRKSPIVGKSVTAALLLILAAIGYMNRVNLLKNGFDWYNDVYVSVPANLDLFLGGFLLNFITLKDSPQKKLPKWARLTVKITSIVLLMLLIAYTSYLYFIGERYDIVMLDIYRYELPTAFLLIVCLYLFAFDYEKNEKQAPLTLRNFARNPLRILDFLSDISFEIYMFHSLIYSRIQLCFAPYESIPEHLGFVLFGLVLSCILGYGFHKALAPKQKKKAENGTTVA